jgi:hypothetical protein
VGATSNKLEREAAALRDAQLRGEGDTAAHSHSNEPARGSGAGGGRTE